MKTAEPRSLSLEDVANPVVRALAEAYRASRLGSTGKARRAFSIRYEKLVYERACADVGDERCARTILLNLESMNVVRLTRKPLAREKILSVFIEPDAEARFFELLNESPPTSERRENVVSLLTHMHALREHHYSIAWNETLRDAMDDIANGRSPDGLPNDTSLHDEVLRAAAAVLNNRSPISLRRLGAEKLRDSKLLRRRRDSIERFLAQFLPPELANFEAWQVADEPPSVQLHGPMGVELDNGRLVHEVGRHSPYTVSDESLTRAQRVFTSAKRCISIENLAVFREMAKAHSGNLLVHTSYPSSSVVRLLRSLPPIVQLLHWGDTDPWGYDILRVLRQKSGRQIEALHMKYRPGPGPSLSKRELSMIARMLEDPLLADVKTELLAIREAGNKGLFEQESLPTVVIEGRL